ncbi:arginase [Helicobacter mustelae]|uniref:Arginase n=1 Tax=Helicobacter mustelae (strain ATCC 43772 / CCUG 25715 / CIP 103759 / LMG 18044 / NCTC 12198 / R85-136P) TaxID=679897 RepID=D3UGX3_HELM1|nr:arginase [Helicobacter mustelae]CBG39745.1 Putative arginase [Helicobacter mustelae 12198]SQH71251.1 arginase [Helicobacter mustelae]STP12377.1 arginase [Helicobacter mustelae]
MILVGLEAQLGASKQGSDEGVKALIEALRPKHGELVRHMHRIAQERCILDKKFRYARSFEDYYVFCKEILIPRMQEVFLRKEFSLILSSEHANMFGIFQALRSVHKDKKIGILYLDAHADIHTAYDSDSRYIHGMPLGMVLNRVRSGFNCMNQSEEEAWQELCNLGLEKGTLEIDPRHLVYFGVRSTEQSERDVIKELQIPLFGIDSIRENMQEVVEQSKILLRDVDIIYLSLDLDIMDGKLFTSTGVRENHGLSFKELREFLQLLLEGFKDRLSAVEVTEYNPLVGLKNEEKEVLEILKEIIRICKDSSWGASLGD